MTRASKALPATLRPILCLDDFEAAARRHLPPPVFAHVSGGVALALGARFVFVGRPSNCAASVAGGVG